MKSDGPNIKVKRGKWVTGHFCVDCEAELSFNSMMYNHGTCPACGFLHKDACTIVRCLDRSYRIVKESMPWWYFKRAIKYREFKEA